LAQERATVSIHFLVMAGQVPAIHVFWL